MSDTDFKLTERQCTATNRNGERCKNRPVPFQQVCVNHGAKSYTAIQAADRLKIIAAEPAWLTLIELLDHSDAYLRRKVAVDILDRSGFAPGLKLQVSRTPDDLVHLSNEELAAQATAIAAQFTAMALPPLQTPPAEDVLLLDEPAEHPGHSADTSGENAPVKTGQTDGAEVCTTPAPDAAEVPRES